MGYIKHPNNGNLPGEREREGVRETERESHHKNSTVGGTLVTGSHLKVAGIHNQGNYTTIAIHTSKVSPRVGDW